MKTKKILSIFLLATTLVTSVAAFTAPQNATALVIPETGAIPGAGGGAPFGIGESSDVCDGSGGGGGGGIDIDGAIAKGTEIVGKVGEEVLKSIPGLGGILGGLFGGGDDVAGTDDDPYTTKPRCEILDARSGLLKNNRSETQQIITGLLKDYKITDYLGYARKLSYQVYVTKQLLNKNAAEQLIILSNARRILNITENEPDLEGVYKQKALASSGICSSTLINCSNLTLDVDSPTAVYNSIPIGAIIDPMTATPAGQRLSYEIASSKVVSNASSAADLGALNGSGNKDSYACKLSGSLQDCSVKNPGSLSQSNIDGQINALANFQLTPPDWKTLVAGVNNKPVNEFLKTMLLGGGGLLGGLGDFLGL